MRKILIIIFVIILIILTTISATGLQITKTESKSTEENIETLGISNKNCALFVSGTWTADWPESDEIFERVATDAKDMFDSYGSYETWLRVEPSKSSIRDVIENQIPEKLGNNKQIFMYFGAHGDSAGTLLIKRVLGVPVGLNAIELGNWVDNMQSNLKDKGKSYSYCTIVIESCFSGNHINELSNDNRIVITSTDSDHSAYGSDAGEMYFSDAFFSALSDGNTYGKSWELADKFIDTYEGIEKQDPKIEDTGNKKSVGSDDPDTLPIWDGDTTQKDKKDGNICS